MPVPSSSAISSDIGHGSFGARSGLRTFKELVGESAGQRHVWVELRPGKLMSGSWTNVTGNSWTIALSETFDGRTLHPITVEVASGVCERNHSTGGVDSVAGRFHWDGSTLRVHLPENEDPNSETVVVRLALFVGTAGVTHSLMGFERLSNGSFEDFTASAPDDWTQSDQSGGDIVPSETTESPYHGGSALRLTLSSADATDHYNHYQSASLIAQVWYAFSGYYRGEITAGAASFQAYVLSSGPLSILPDGVSSSASNTACIDVTAETGGDWRHFVFYFRAPSTASWNVYVRPYATAAGTSGTLDFDRCSLRQVFQWAPHDPRLTLSSVPHIEATRSDAFYGPISSGLGSLILANNDGHFDTILAEYDWANAPVIIRAGGKFAGGNDIPLSDCPIVARARATRPEVMDAALRFALEDQREVAQTLLPINTISSGTLEDRDQASSPPRTVVLGHKMEWSRPVRVAVEANNLGTYEVCDPTFTSAGEATADLLVTSYLNEEGADTRNFEDGVGLVNGAGNDVSFSARTGSGVGRITILREVRPIRIDESNRIINFNIGGAELRTSIAMGTRSPVGLCNVIASGMNSTAGTADITCTLSTTTHKITIAKGAGTLQLLCRTGSAQDRIWPAIGFYDTDRTGSLSYTGDAALFEDTRQHILRVRSNGVCDDSAGTYTGTAYQQIQYASEIAHYILGAILKIPAAEIDVDSFVEARTNVTNRMLGGVYLGAAEKRNSMAEIFEWIETAGGADIRLEDGLWSWHWRETTAEAGVVDIYTRDFLTFSAGYDPDDVVKTLDIGYNHDWVTGGFAVLSSTDDAIGVRFGRERSRLFPSAARTLSVVNVQTRLKNEAQTKRRRFRFSVKGKALLRPVGSQLRLTRSRGLDTTGELDAVLCRIIKKRDDLARWVSDVEAIEVV